jgi:hypothetical protein
MAKTTMPIKIVYFDESTALDYIDIKEDGRYAREITRSAETSGKVSAGAKAESPSIFSSLFSARAEITTSAEGAKIIRNTISNTILTDYLKKARRTKSLSFLEGYTLSLTETSTMLLATAFTDATQGNIPFDEKGGLNMDISKLSTTLNALQGYIECYARDKSGNISIFRFNTKGFRNNYKLPDVLSMNLTSYGVNVGRSSGLSLNAIGFGNKESAPTQEYDMYDIVLAGVFA